MLITESITERERLLRIVGEGMKKVKWKLEMGCYIAFCPHCGEPAYLEDHCEFCGKQYKWREGRYRPREVVVGKYTAVQTSGKSIYITDNDDNRLLYHITHTKRLSKRKLRKFVKHLKGASDERN